MSKNKIAIVGTGNVATRFAGWLAPLSDTLSICGRNFEHASAIAKEHPGTIALSSFGDIPPDTDFIIIAVSDGAIHEITPLIPKGPIWLHTAGSVDIDVLDVNVNRGVIYPLQTISKNLEIDSRSVKFFIEASNPHTLEKVRNLVSMLSPEVVEMDSKSRLKLHAAAVIACNFTNYLLSLSSDILKDVNLEIDSLEPLIKETVRKAIAARNPFDYQTGPAVREDFKTIAGHLDILPDNIKDIYKILSEGIIARKRTHE